jgi:hypothetical protein
MAHRCTDDTSDGRAAESADPRPFSRVVKPPPAQPTGIRIRKIRINLPAVCFIGSPLLRQNARVKARF